MKALIVSDNHGNLDSLEELIDIYQDDVDLWLHCGDSELKAENPIWDTFATVKGNTDFDYSLASHQEKEFGGEKILIVHGHQQRVDFTLDKLNNLAEKENADIVFYGHTHIAKVDKVGNRYFINPGSIIEPRGELQLGSYAIYEKDEEGRFISFYDWNHNKLPNLSKKLAE
ncbi:MAG: metallophosphoesterase [Atopostipes sp.]|nr:metallophosphoesterase [Atopostipes sp.]